MAKLSIKDLALSGKRVVMRVDFNVPMKERLKQSRCLLIPQF
jgi:3-phosphoglycerate kinase